jgi:hypothetical protein
LFWVPIEIISIVDKYFEFIRSDFQYIKNVPTYIRREFCFSQAANEYYMAGISILRSLLLVDTLAGLGH